MPHNAFNLLQVGTSVEFDRGRRLSENETLPIYICQKGSLLYTLVNFGCTKPVLLGTEMKVCTKHILISTPLYQGRLVHGVPEVY